MSREKSHAINQKGFSLLELLLVMIISCVILAMVYIKFRPDFDSGSAEKAIETVAEKVAGRRDEAIRLNGLAAATSLETEVAPLVEIDFSDPETTASLIINGDDTNGDHLDDDTGEVLTYLSGNVWQYSYRDDPMKLPSSWNIVPEGNLTVQPIYGRGRGTLVTRIGFDATGHVYGFHNGAWQKYPADSSTNQQESPFWAIYLERSGAGQNQETLAVAIAVYPSGQIEKFRFDGSKWRGWRGRTIE
jgi:prepilin-type N-terminal cleavage/methylation domain-containing protein